MNKVDRGTRILAERGGFDKLVFNGAARVVSFGPSYAGENGQDWTFKPFTREADGADEKNKETSVAKYLPEIAHGLMVRDILVPSPVEFNAVICNEKDLMEKIPIRDANGREICLHRGTYADGLRYLGIGKTFGISSAGCPLLLVYYEDKKHLGIAHAGRQSLIDESQWIELPRKRKKGSVVDTLLGAMAHKLARKEMQAIILFPIAPELLTYSWDDPKHGRVNEARSRFVMEHWGEACVPGWNNEETQRRGIIDLDALIRAQLVKRGMYEEHITSIPLPRGWYTTRGDFPNRRNLTLIKRA